MNNQKKRKKESIQPDANYNLIIRRVNLHQNKNYYIWYFFGQHIKDLPRYENVQIGIHYYYMRKRERETVI